MCYLILTSNDIKRNSAAVSKFIAPGVCLKPNLTTCQLAINQITVEINSLLYELQVNDTAATAEHHSGDGQGDDHFANSLWVQWEQS